MISPHISLEESLKEKPKTERPAKTYTPEHFGSSDFLTKDLGVSGKLAGKTVSHPNKSWLDVGPNEKKVVHGFLDKHNVSKHAKGSEHAEISRKHWQELSNDFGDHLESLKPTPLTDESNIAKNKIHAKKMQGHRRLESVLDTMKGFGTSPDHANLTKDERESISNAMHSRVSGLHTSGEGEGFLNNLHPDLANSFHPTPTGTNMDVDKKDKKAFENLNTHLSNHKNLKSHVKTVGTMSGTKMDRAKWSETHSIVSRLKHPANAKKALDSFHGKHGIKVGTSDKDVDRFSKIAGKYADHISSSTDSHVIDPKDVEHYAEQLSDAREQRRTGGSAPPVTPIMTGSKYADHHEMPDGPIDLNKSKTYMSDMIKYFDKKSPTGMTNKFAMKGATRSFNAIDNMSPWYIGLAHTIEHKLMGTREKGKKKDVSHIPGLVHKIASASPFGHEHLRDEIVDHIESKTGKTMNEEDHKNLDQYIEMANFSARKAGGSKSGIVNHNFRHFPGYRTIVHGRDKPRIGKGHLAVGKEFAKDHTKEYRKEMLKQGRLSEAVNLGSAATDESIDDGEVLQHRLGKNARMHLDEDSLEVGTERASQAHQKRIREQLGSAVGEHKKELEAQISGQPSFEKVGSENPDADKIAKMIVGKRVSQPGKKAIMVTHQHQDLAKRFQAGEDLNHEDLRKLGIRPEAHDKNRELINHELSKLGRVDRKSGAKILNHSSIQTDVSKLSKALEGKVPNPEHLAKSLIHGVHFSSKLSNPEHMEEFKKLISDHLEDRKVYSDDSEGEIHKAQDMAHRSKALKSVLGKSALKYWMDPAHEDDSEGSPDHNWMINVADGLRGHGYNLDSNAAEHVGSILNNHVLNGEKPRSIGKSIRNVTKREPKKVLKALESTRDRLLRKKKSAIEGSQVGDVLEGFLRGYLTPEEKMRKRIFKSTIRNIYRKKLFNEDEEY